MGLTPFQDNFSGSSPFEFAAGSVFGFRYFWFPGWGELSYSIGRDDLIPKKKILKFFSWPVPVDEGKLIGAREVLWQTGTMDAYCQVALYDTLFRFSQGSSTFDELLSEPFHSAPDENCSCGIYAYWQADKWPGISPSGFPVMGVVEGSGPTIIGTLGFRTSRARIVGLHVPFKLWPYRFPYVRYNTKREIKENDWRSFCDLPLMYQRLSDRYEAPVYDTLEELIEAHPLTSDYLGEQ